MLHESAPAKVNLYLHITGKKADNYHLLDSLVVFANVGDKIEAVISDDLSLEIAGEYNQEIDLYDNSVLKTAIILQEAYKIPFAAELKLHKNLPVGAGIGGGSADAAATIRALQKLWLINKISPEIPLALGADVPACLYNTPLYMSGIGENIEPAELPDLHILLVNNRQPLLTAEVFKRYKCEFSASTSHPNFTSQNELIDFLKTTKNDLQNIAIEIMPEIAIMLAEIEKQPDCLLARMSGSGATCFGLFSDKKSLELAKANLRNQHPNWWIEA